MCCESFADVITTSVTSVRAAATVYTPRKMRRSAGVKALNLTECLHVRLATAALGPLRQSGNQPRDSSTDSAAPLGP